MQNWCKISRPYLVPISNYSTWTKRTPQKKIFWSNPYKIVMITSLIVFLDITKVADFRWKMLMSAEFMGCVTWFIYFFNLLYIRYNCAKFHHCRTCVTDFRRGFFCPPPPPPIREQPKMPILNRVKIRENGNILLW